MGRYIIKLEDYYLEWSTIVDAPVTYGMSLEEFKQHYREEYGNSSMPELEQRLRRVEEGGTSALNGMTIQDVISGNRAGPDGAKLSLEEVITAYCQQEPIRNGWLP